MEQRYINVFECTRRICRAERKAHKRRMFWEGMKFVGWSIVVLAVVGGILNLTGLTAHGQVPYISKAVMPIHDVQRISQRTLEEAITEDAVALVIQNKATFVATAYCGCDTCCGVWASMRGSGPICGAAGVPLFPGVSVAVDNSIFAFGTTFTDEQGNAYVAADTGSGVKGYHIDIYMSDHQQAKEFGRQEIVLSW